MSCPSQVVADLDRDAPDHDGRGNTDADDRSWIDYGAILGLAVDLGPRGMFVVGLKRRAP